MKKFRLICVISLLCSGCASTQKNQEQLALLEQYRAAYKRCEAQYPAYPELEPKTAVASVKCFSSIPSPFPSDNDLLNLVNATRLAVAEKLEKGQVTQAEAKQQISLEVSRAVTELERRGFARRSVDAMEAAARPKSTTCYAFGNSMTCF